MTTLSLTAWQRFRTRAYLFGVGLRKRLTVGVRAVVLDGDRVLLIKPTYLPGWQFPGGGVEPGETAEAAAVRETLEEAGVAVEGRGELHGLFLNRIAGGARDHVVVYVWRRYHQHAVFKPNLEIAECRWFGLEALPADIEPGAARRLAEIAGSRDAPGDW
ncbi:MAG: NUDIX domain-containing protein [Devosia sp.]